MAYAPKEALDYLSQHPETTDQFRQQFGYQPAPSPALDYLYKNPHTANQFQDTFGYLPKDLNQGVVRRGLSYANIALQGGENTALDFVFKPMARYEATVTGQSEDQTYTQQAEDYLKTISPSSSFQRFGNLIGSPTSNEQANVRRGTLPGKIAEGAGSLVPYIAAGAVNPALPLVLGGAQGGEAARERQEAYEKRTGQKITAGEAAIDIAGNTALGVAQGLPAERLVGGPIARTLMPAASGAIARMGQQAALQGAVQAGGQLGSNLLSRETYNPAQSPWEGVAQQGIVGGLIGAPFGLAVHNPSAPQSGKDPNAIANDLNNSSLVQQPQIDQQQTPVASPTVSRIDVLKGQLATETDPAIRKIISRQIGDEQKHDLYTSELPRFIDSLSKTTDPALKAELQKEIDKRQKFLKKLSDAATAATGEAPTPDETSKLSKPDRDKVNPPQVPEPEQNEAPAAKAATDLTPGMAEEEAKDPAKALDKLSKEVDLDNVDQRIVSTGKVPWTAGTNIAGDQVHIDESIPKFAVFPSMSDPAKKVTINMHNGAAVHELAERNLLEQNEDYKPDHKQAQAIEDEWYRRQDVDPALVQKWWDPRMKKLEKEAQAGKMKNRIAPDLDPTPYHEFNGTELLEKNGLNPQAMKDEFEAQRQIRENGGNPVEGTQDNKNVISDAQLVGPDQHPLIRESTQEGAEYTLPQTMDATMSSSGNGKPRHSHEEIKQTVQDIHKNWVNGPDLHVWNNLKEAQDAGHLHGIVENDRRSALFTSLDNSIHIFTDNVKSKQRAITALMHEGLGHGGLRAVFGKTLVPLLDRIARFRVNDMLHAQSLYGMDKDKLPDRYRLAEEVLAMMAQKGEKNNFIQNAIAIIRRWMRQFPAFHNMPLTDMEIRREYLEPAARYIKEGTNERKFRSMVGTEDKLSTNQIANETAEVVASIAKPFTKGYDGLLKLFAPQLRSEDARIIGNLLREFDARLARTNAINNKLLEAALAHFDVLPEPTRMDFIYRMEAGQAQADNRLQGLADTFRKILDNKKAEIQALGVDKYVQWIEDYFPHIWKDPEAMRDAIVKWGDGNKMAGSKAFMKEREVDSVRLGVEKFHMQLADTNPAKLIQMKLREMDKFIMSHNFFETLKANGLVKFFPESEKPSFGYDKINDNISNVFGPRIQGGVLKKGEYYAAAPVAKLINNYLSPGLRDPSNPFSGLYTAWHGFANALNMAQLGISAFHLGFTCYDTMISKLALAMEIAVNDRDLGKAAMKAATIIKAPFEAASPRINQIYQGWFGRGGQGEETMNFIQEMLRGGARVGMDEFYTNKHTERMWRAFKQLDVSSGMGQALRHPFAAIELMSKPIMEVVVPRQKLAVFYDMAQHELERLPPGADNQERREALTKAWDSVENRMGQMTYNNLFWNKAVKDLSFVAVRSVGWNLGTIREVVGGGMDAVKQFDNLFKGQGFELTHRMAYTISMIVMTGLIGASVNYLTTGQAPQKLEDYFFINTGQKDSYGNDIKLSQPSYVKDLFEYGHAPLRTLGAKLNPSIVNFLDLINNRDYYNTEIRHPDDAIGEQFMQVAQYLGKGFIPFSIKNVINEGQQGMSAAPQVAGFLGFPKAPYWLDQSNAEQLASQINKNHFAAGSRTQAEFDRGQTIQQAVRLLRDNTNPASIKEGNDLVQNSMHQRIIDPRDLQKIYEQVTQPHLEHMVQHMSGDEIWKVWQAATPEEKSQIVGKVAGTIGRDQRLTPEQQKQYEGEIMQFIKANKGNKKQ